jgi:hypothetical protein
VIEQLLEADRQLQVDQVERARQIYGRVVAADPGNAIAVVGLARCALADRHDREAYDLAQQALRIDPENDMARRMSERLAEVLTHRGQPVDGPETSSTPEPGGASGAGPSAAGVAAPPPVPAQKDAATATTDSSRRSLIDRLLGR